MISIKIIKLHFHEFLMKIDEHHDLHDALLLRHANFHVHHVNNYHYGFDCYYSFRQLSRRGVVNGHFAAHTLHSICYPSFNCPLVTYLLALFLFHPLFCRLIIG